MRTVHRAAAGVTLVASLALVGGASAHAAAAVPDIPKGHVLYVIGGEEDGPKTLYTVASDATLTEVGPLGVTANFDGADFDPVSGTTYAVTVENQDWVFNCGQLFSLDLETGAATLIGALPDEMRCGDIDAAADGTLRLLQYSNPPWADVHVIDPSTATFSAHLKVNVDFHYETRWSFLASQSDLSMFAGNFSNEFYRLNLDDPDESDVYWGVTLEYEGTHHPADGPEVADFDADGRLWGARWGSEDSAYQLTSMRMQDIAATSAVHGDFMDGDEQVEVQAIFFGPVEVEEEAAAPALAATGAETAGLLIGALGALALGVALTARRQAMRHTR